MVQADLNLLVTGRPPVSASRWTARPLLLACRVGPASLIRLDRLIRSPQAAHAALINEYDWLWLHRDGTPTQLSRKVYEQISGSPRWPPARSVRIA